MKTRTLLLLALGCGVAIMVAGAVLLVQLTGRDEVAPASRLGDEVVIGDMHVVVDGFSEEAGTITIAIRIGGVDDADGAAGFTLIASGRPLTAEPSGADACGATTLSVEPCLLRFNVSAATDGESRVLFYDRGDGTARWALS